MKVSTRVIKEMRELRAKGRTLKEIATKFGVQVSTVQYNVDPTQKEKHTQRAKARREKLREEGKLKEYYAERNAKKSSVEARRRYQAEHYANDPEFRELQKARVRIRRKYCNIKQLKEVKGKLIHHINTDHLFLQLNLPSCKEKAIRLPKSWCKFFDLELGETEVEILIRKKAKVGG